jgi:hypothetical protein
VNLGVRCAAGGHLERRDQVHLPYMGPSFACPDGAPLRDPVIALLDSPSGKRARQRWNARMTGGVLVVRAEPVSSTKSGR